MSVNTEVVEEWVEALESDQYTQTKGRLRRIESAGDSPAGFCCLGVLCDLAVKKGIVEAQDDVDGDYDTAITRYGDEDDWDSSELPITVQKWAGLPSYTPDVDLAFGDAVSVVELNDSRGWDFKQIAAALRRTYLGEGK